MLPYTAIHFRSVAPLLTSCDAAERRNKGKVLWHHTDCCADAMPKAEMLWHHSAVTLFRFVGTPSQRVRMEVWQSGTTLWHHS